jgi:hypothetical protein
MKVRVELIVLATKLPLCVCAVSVKSVEHVCNGDRRRLQVTELCGTFINNTCPGNANAMIVTVILLLVGIFFVDAFLQ